MTTSTTQNQEANPETGESTTQAESEKNKKEFINKSEYDALQAKLNDLSAKYRQTSKQLETLSTEKQQLELKKAEEAGDVSKIREEYSKDIEAKKADIIKWESLYKDEKKNLGFLQIVKGLNILDESISDFYELEKNNIEVELVDNTYKLVVRGSHKDPKDYLEEKLKAKPYFLKPNGVGGAGAQNSNTGNTNSKTQYSLDQLDAMSPQDFNAAVKNNPELAKMWAKQR